MNKHESAARQALADVRDPPATCPKCGGEMAQGIALESTATGSPDFTGGEVVTVSHGGPGRLINCRKCVSCGWSVK